jgi:phosphatidylglycerol:prolipoprotein diacylglycerol transferase
MYPELFEIPFIHVTVKSYGLMMVIGFLAAVSVIRYLSRDITPNPQYITNAALYSLIAGVLGARVFYVVHHADQFQERLASVFAIWQGGLELLGGVVLAITVIFFYLCYHKLPIRRYLDILAIGLMLALVFGRIGCFLNGCCFGKPTNLPWAVRFPYGSFAYRSQIYPNLTRNRSEPQLKLPAEFCIYPTNGNAILPQHLKPYAELTEEQKDMVDNGQYRCLAVHPTQLYSSATAAVLCLVLYLFWRRSVNAAESKGPARLFANHGCTFALMFILYGIARFFIEFLRDDNPFEVDSLTISQLLGIALVVFGAVLMAIFQRLKPTPPAH